MRKRTSFELSNNGVVRCNCGCINDFVEDLNEFIVPMLESTIQARFNGRTITVSCWDNADKILEKFRNVMGAR